MKKIKPIKTKPLKLSAIFKDESLMGCEEDQSPPFYLNNIDYSEI